MIPLFVAFIFAFIVLLRIIIVEIVLQSAVDNSVKQLSIALVPFEAQLKSGSDQLDSWISSDSLVKIGIPEIAQSIIGEIVDGRKLTEAALEPVLAASVKPVVWSYIPEAMRGKLVQSQRMRVVSVSVPYMNNNQLIFAIAVEYRLPIILPFYKKEWIIRKSATERVWFGR